MLRGCLDCDLVGAEAKAGDDAAARQLVDEGGGQGLGDDEQCVAIAEVTDEISWGVRLDLKWAQAVLAVEAGLTRADGIERCVKAHNFEVGKRLVVHTDLKMGERG